MADIDREDLSVNRRLIHEEKTSAVSFSIHTIILRTGGINTYINTMKQKQYNIGNDT